MLQQLFFWRTCLLHCLAGVKSCEQVQQIFQRVALQARDLGNLAPSLLLFVRAHLGSWLAGQEADFKVGKCSADELLRRVRVAEAVLASARGGSTGLRASVPESEDDV
ncbi:MI domain-containing protein [Haematococcus lacustris]|uniref:MI domain-containing protein n=1 Tax=Haematococcus lacustris TaxID=44745 RepID=A0A6A0AGF1_HAELA|nr:MI domain-containing protein [Haematococcus lacustris]